MAVGKEQLANNKLKTMIGSFRNLTVYKKAFSLAMEIFEITKQLPPEEKYELTESNQAIIKSRLPRNW
ncbi:MAG: four helix bundle protein [Bacteroidales bacterium]|nr:four helix bundle protein [Bacteroidales bacterium]